MTELASAAGAGALWLAVFAALVLALRGHGASTGPTVLIAYALFVAAQVILAIVLGAVGALTGTGIRTAYLAGLAILTGLVVLRRRRNPRKATESITPVVGRADIPSDGAARTVRRIALATTCLVFAALTVFTLVVPVRIWDTLAYHMPMVASYIQNASLDAWPTQDLRQIYRVNTGELQMLNLALLARSDAWVELPNLLGLAVVLVASFELARLTFHRPLFPWVVVLLVLSAPQIVIGAGSEKNDLSFTAALLSAFYWMIRAGLAARPASTAHVSMAAVSAAMAGATKVMGLNVAGATGLLALVLAARRRLLPRDVAVYTAVVITALLVLAGSVYLYNAGRSPVPVGVAPGEVHYTFGPANITEAVRYYVLDLTLKRLVIIPRLEHDFLHYGYLFPFMLGLGFLGAVRQRTERRFVPICLAVLAAALLLSVIAVRQPIGWDQRFMIWLVPTFAILALTTAERMADRRLVVVAWVAATLAAANVAVALGAESDFLFRRSALHVTSAGELPRYLDVPNRRYLHMRDGYDTLDAAAAPGDSILYAGTDDSWMYPLWGRRFTRHVEGVWDADHASAQIASRRFRFVVVEHGTAPEILSAAGRHTAASGYAILAAERDRTIFVRDAYEGALPTPLQPARHDEAN
ncbi:MAG TPA: hypothetical protein VK936_13935 [Longimicrobiales bacterium]|nr:hypothetical protein [Longimicrobiales bacterium]